MVLCCDDFVTMEKRNEMILQNLPLVAWVLARTRAGNIEREDAWASGCEGLIAAIDNYDPEKGSTFASYAVLRIRGAILDSARRADPLGRRRRADVHRLDAAVASISLRLGGQPSRAQLAEALGMTTDEVALIERDADLGTMALEWAEPTDPDRAVDPAEVASRRDDLADLRRALATLDERDELVIRLHYQEDRPLREVAEMMGLSESRVCGLSRRALRRLREALEAA